MKSILSTGLLLLCIVAHGQEIASAEVQIAQALLAAPEAQREGAAVLGYDESGQLVTLREGTNELICLARDPQSKGFSVACYHKELDSFMARGRALKAEGKEFQEIFDIREEEVKAGKLEIPNNSSLMVCTGDMDPETGEVTNTYVRYVVYIPFATGATTGLSETPLAPGLPWLMNAGTHRAHIMITPKRDK